MEEEIAEERTVVQRLTLRGTQRGAYLGISPTGERVTWQAIAIQRAGPDGKLVELRIIFDRLELMAQLGASAGAMRPEDNTGGI